MQAWLETTSGVRVALQAVCSIGRSSKNSLVLDNAEVSRRHALIHAQGNEHWLVDLGSSNGVQLNNRRGRQPIRLRDLDRLEIAGNVFIFHEVEPAPEKEDRVQTTCLTLKDSHTAPRWLMVADIEGSTRLSQSLATDELSQLFGKWFLVSKEIVENLEGSINKYLGDGYLAYWPKPEQSPDTIARTLSELKTLQNKSAPPFRLAVHYGAVTVDKEVSAGEESLLGPEVNFVFRMEKLAASLQQRCLLSEPAAKLLKPFGDAAPVGSHVVQGFDRKYGFFSY
ncbi:MAG: FHA domain-containing protein [Limisphaerales bacterium]